MESSNITTTAALQPSTTILHDLRPMLLIYSDGRIERLMGTDTLPPNPDDDVVPSKDVQISSTVSARLYLPKISLISPNQTNSTKLPLLIYFHGGGFAIETASSPTYHNYLPTLATKSSTIIVSVNYRLAPEHPLPTAYNDCWSAIEWVSTSTDPWITNHADLTRVYFAGDSAGGNIAHHMGIRFGNQNPPGLLHLSGLVLIHPFFLGEEPVYGDNGPEVIAGREFGKRFWKVVCGDHETQEKGVDHPWINPEKDVELSKMGCKRVLVFVAEKDSLRNRGVYYGEQVLGKCDEWGGNVEVFESRGEGHVFHLINPGCMEAVKLMDKFVAFING